MSTERRGTLRRDLRPLVGVVLAIVVALIAGCAAPTREPIGTDPDFVGFIVAAGRVSEAGVEGLVVVESHADKIVTRYVVALADDAAILEKDGDSYQPARFSALRPKQWVWVWFAEPAPDSFGARVEGLQIVTVSQEDASAGSAGAPR